MTPNRPEAICLIADLMESPFSIFKLRSGSSPPSPVFDLPPSLFMATASVECDFHRDGAVGHCPRDESSSQSPSTARPGQLGTGCALVEIEVEHTPRKCAMLDLLVLGERVRLVGLVVLGADGVLDIRDADRIVDVWLAAIAPMVLARLLEPRDLADVSWLGKPFSWKANASWAIELERSCRGYELPYQQKPRSTTAVVNAECFEDLGSLVGLQGGDSHLAHDFQDATIARCLVVGDDLLVRQLLANEALAVELENALHRQDMG